MVLFNKSLAYKCARCKKKISDGEFIWIGNHRFCLDCEKPHSLKPIVKHATPVIKSSTIKNSTPEDRKSHSHNCKRCKNKISDYQYECINGHIFCLKCAQLPIGYALDNNGDRFKFHYPVTDMHQEDKYWDVAINKTNSRTQNRTIVKPEDIDCVEIVQIRTKEDFEYPTDCDYDWDTNLWVYANDERNVWYFELHEDYLSEWDAFPVYSGGYVSLNEAKEYLHHIGNHTYDYIFPK